MREPQKIVIHYLDGRLERGYGKFFFSNQNTLRILDLKRRPVRIPLAQVKAVFFVRRLRGRKDYHETKRFSPRSPMFGRKVEIRFRDGEVMRGRALDYRPEDRGFYLKPSDPGSNNEMVFVPVTALKRVKVA